MSYTIVDTNQTLHYDEDSVISSPVEGELFFGQDAYYTGNTPSYIENGDGTVSDLNTGLTWGQAYVSDVTYTEAVNGAASYTLGGYTDWRLPTIKELYSLMDFSGYTGSSATTSSPYLDTNYFEFTYGDTANGDRFIDAQYWSATEYVSTTMYGNSTTFGVNFADGRIKGYPNAEVNGADMERYVRYVRGNEEYGENSYTDNGDGTITDQATDLMWTQSDNGTALSWEDALAWAENLNFAGYSDWRLPNAKELHSIVDYSRSPDTTNSAAINPLFQVTEITNGVLDYPYYWSSTTHIEGQTGDHAVYFAFGEASGYLEDIHTGDYNLTDVHGAGAQRSDPKTGDPADYPNGFGPQGDVISIYNYARAVRDDTNTSGEGGTAGNDFWVSTIADETFDGAAGIDTVEFSLEYNRYLVSASADQISVSGPEGSDTLLNIERIHFSDRALAFDMVGNAGMTAKVLGAVFGSDTVENTTYAGIGLNYLDNQGYDYASLMQLALDARLGASASYEDVVNLLYTNVAGVMPSTSALAFYTGLLETGQHTTASLGVLAADTELNAANIDILGLSASGFEYSPI